jgi:hypothetical protein
MLGRLGRTDYNRLVLEKVYQPLQSAELALVLRQALMNKLQSSKLMRLLEFSFRIPF